MQILHFSSQTDSPSFVLYGTMGHNGWYTGVFSPRVTKMGKIRKAILQQEKEALKKKIIIPRKEEEWDVSEEGFYKDDVDGMERRKGTFTVRPVN